MGKGCELLSHLAVKSLIVDVAEDVELGFPPSPVSMLQPYTGVQALVGMTQHNRKVFDGLLQDASGVVEWVLYCVMSVRNRVACIHR
jgi:hypothetical protein